MLTNVGENDSFMKNIEWNKRYFWDEEKGVTEFQHLETDFTDILKHLQHLVPKARPTILVDMSNE
jgi:hypothetical protein